MKTFYQTDDAPVGGIEPQEQPNTLSVGQRIVSVFTNPKAVFESLKMKPDFLTPLIIGAILMFLFMFVNADLVRQESIDNIQKNEKLTEEMRENQIAGLEQLSQGQVMMFFVAIPVAGMVVVYFIMGLIYLVVGNFIMGGKGSYTQILSIYGYSSLIIGIVALAVKWLLVATTGTLHVYTSIAALLPLEQEKTFLFQFLDLFDIFYLWFTYVLGMGYAILYGWELKKGLIMTFGLYFLYGLGKAALTALF
ncbi:MAG: hypothetical protein Kow00108_20750 [Calditrichia bacterium]